MVPGATLSKPIKGTPEQLSIDPRSGLMPSPAKMDESATLQVEEATGQFDEAEAAQTMAVDDSAIVEDGLYNVSRGESATQEDAYLFAELTFSYRELPSQRQPR